MKTSSCTMLATLINTPDLQYISRQRLEELSVWLDRRLEGIYQEMEDNEDPFAELAGIEEESPLTQLGQWLSSGGHLIATLSGLNDLIKEEIVKKTAH